MLQAADINLHPTPAHGIISEEAGSYPWPWTATGGLIWAVWEECTQTQGTKAARLQAKPLIYPHLTYHPAQQTNCLICGGPQHPCLGDAEHWNRAGGAGPSC